MIIRSDTMPKIGAGHVIRCLALAQAWKKGGGNVTFACQFMNEVIQNRIINSGMDLLGMATPSADLENPEQFLLVLEKLKARHGHNHCLVTLDGYHFGEDYQKSIREAGYRLLVIDDINHLPYYHASVLLNPNIHADSLIYHCDQDTSLLLGPRYVLLLEEFRLGRDRRRETQQVASRILVTLGATDLKNQTIKTIRALKKIDVVTLDISIILGPTNPNGAEIKRELNNFPHRVHVHINVYNMQEFMSKSDIAISAGGSTCWEMAFMGLPNVIIALSQDQQSIAQGLAEKGISINLGWYESVSEDQIAQALKELIFDHKTRSAMSLKGQTLIDGRGTERVIKHLISDQKFLVPSKRSLAT